MIVTRRACCFTVSNLCRFASTTGVTTNENFQFGSKFNDVERERILSILNTSDLNGLSRFNIAQARLKSLISWKNKNGPFLTLSDLLEVDGLGVTMLEKFCKSILINKDTDTIVTTSNNNKQKRSILTPVLNKEEIKNLTSAVGLHIESTGISWARLTRSNNELTHWNYYDFSALPKKITPVDTFNLTIRIVQDIPLADVYVFESRQSTLSGNNSSKMIPPHLHQLELTSMLLALINTNKGHQNEDCFPNKVYYLRSRLPARLFGTLVGSERVSAETTILNIINGNKTDKIQQCSKISVEPKLTEIYGKCPKGYKDLLEQALLLVISFMDLCVYNNPISHKAINRVRK